MNITVISINIITQNLTSKKYFRNKFDDNCPVDGLVEVQIQFKLLHETLFFTIFTIVGFLSVEGKDVHRSRLQLVGVAAMYPNQKVII